jgi:Ca2+-binding RTX toxin-like protein
MRRAAISDLLDEVSARSVRPVLILAVVLFAAFPAAPALAGHVSATLQVSARLGERLSDTSWIVIVDWSITCSGPAPGQANYTGNLNLDDVGSGEVIYMGGTSSASGSDQQPVTRHSVPRSMRPRIKASCFDSGMGNHGSGTSEVTGNTVSVPGLGDEDADGVRDGGSGGGGSSGGDGAQGTRDFPRARFGGPRDPLRSGGCAVVREGTSGADTLNGTAAADLLLGLAGGDVLRGRGDDDCLIGGSGKDRLVGGPGHDRLTGGAGADTLTGGPGVNRYDAGAGNDVVNARNGRAELVSCGTGRDRATVDRSDTVRGCERVARAG